jgi:hypothetical protein
MNDDWNPITVGELIEVLSKLDPSMEISMVLRDEYDWWIQKGDIKVIQYKSESKPCVLFSDGMYNVDHLLHGEQPC